MPIVIEELAAAQGADEMRLSPSGRWLALDYSLAVEAPLVVRIDRSGQTKTLTARGFLMGSPADDGTLYYVEQEALNASSTGAANELVNLPARERRTHVRKLGERVRLLSLDGSYGVVASDGERFVLLGGGSNGSEVLVVNRDGKALIRRRLCLPGFRSSADVYTGGRLYNLCVMRATQETDSKDTLNVIALGTTNLEPVWQQTVRAPEILYNDSQLVTDVQHGRLLVFSPISDKILTLRMEDGASGPLLQSPYAYTLHSVPTTNPADRVFLLWTDPARHASSGRGWRLLEVVGDTVSILVDRPDELPPRSLLWHDGKLLLAPYGAPRHSDRDTWEPYVTRYLDLVEPSPSR